MGNRSAKKCARKYALVTGAAGGIGSAISRALSTSGFTVIGVTRGSADLDSNAAVAQWLTADFLCEQTLQEFYAEVQEKQFDVLVNCAGINRVNAFLDQGTDDLRDTLRVNLEVPFRLMQLVTPYMMGNGWGRIVNVSSVWGVVGKAGRAPYSMSKFALLGLSKCHSAEFSQYGVLTNCISPGFVDTPLTRRNMDAHAMAAVVSTTPVGRLATAEEIANLVSWLCSESNTYCTGQNFIIDGGFVSV